MDVGVVVALMGVVCCGQDGSLARRDSCFCHDASPLRQFFGRIDKRKAGFLQLDKYNWLHTNYSFLGDSTEELEA